MLNEFSFHLRFHVLFEISCHLSFHGIWDFMSFEIESEEIWNQSKCGEILAFSVVPCIKYAPPALSAFGLPPLVSTGQLLVSVSNGQNKEYLVDQGWPRLCKFLKCQGISLRYIVCGTSSTKLSCIFRNHINWSSLFLATTSHPPGHLWIAL